MTHKIAFTFGPLEVHDAKEHTHLGVRFVTHSVPTPLNRFQQVRASEWSTGYGLPGTFAETHDQAARFARLEIERVGEEKIAKALARLPVLNHIAEDSMGGIA